MPKKKNGTIKIIGAVAVLLGILATAWGGPAYLNKNYVPREVWNMQCNAQMQQLQQMQKDWIIGQARANLDYWTRREADFRLYLQQNPNSQFYRQEYEKAKYQRREAEKHLRSLEAK